MLEKQWIFLLFSLIWGPMGVKILKKCPIKSPTFFKAHLLPRPGSVVVERSPGMRDVGGSIPSRVKQKTLKFEVHLLCLALSIIGVETDWTARSQYNGLGWDITAYPWRGVVFQWASTLKTGRRSD